MSTPELKIEDEKPMAGLEGFVDKFLGDRMAELEALRGDLKTENYDGLRAVAHNWKGFCEPYGFQGLGLLAKALEDQATAMDKIGCEQTLQNIVIYMEAKEKHLQKVET